MCAVPVNESSRRASAALVIGALCFAAVSVNVLWDASEEHRYHSPDLLGVVLVIAATMTLVAAPRWPWPALVIAGAALAALAALDYSRWVAAGGVALIAGVIALRRPLTEVVLASVGAGVVAAVALADEPYLERGAAVGLTYVVLAVIPVLLWRAASGAKQHRA
jgi:hypothetical protein